MLWSRESEFLCKFVNFSENFHHHAKNVDSGYQITDITFVTSVMAAFILSRTMKH